MALGNTLASAGSSPLTRGKPQRYYRGDLLPRLIPAHAGKTYGSHTRTVPSWAHPRSRGENASIDAKAAELGGSSPLTRGKRGLGGVPGVVDRLIPAHAGKTARPCARLIRWRAHPRSRGENIQTSSQTVKTSGSSPLTREKRRAGCIDGLVQRLIPAHAGKTLAHQVQVLKAQAHPRSRGENSVFMPARWRAWGSSPLTRGKPRAPLRRWPAWRLIPAHAGKTPRRSSARMTRRAHPRSRGENALHPDEVMNALGSSPLTRGKLLGADRALGGRGLIPAHAGKTRPRNHQDQGGGAHPRSRGENFSRPKVTPLLPGSSPLTRGKPRLVGADLPLGRLIPAHAGKTSARE